MSSDSIRIDLLLNQRQHAKKAAAWFHAAETWQPFALLLTDIRDGKSYQAWGFHSFSAYAEDELDLSKGTAVALGNNMGSEEGTPWQGRSCLIPAV